MAADFRNDMDAVDPTTVDNFGPSYPAAQWLNGDPKLAAVGGVTHTGGIILPTKYLEEGTAPAPGWTRTTVAFSNGKQEEVLACQKPMLAVIQRRFRWKVFFNGVTTYYPRSGYVADSGMKGHLQLLAVPRGFSFPVTVTLTGTASKEMDLILRDFDQKVIAEAGRLAHSKDSKKAQFPRFAFYLRFAAGSHAKVGQKGQESIVTPPVIELPEKREGDYFNKIYVGRENLLSFQRLFHEAEDWAKAWDGAGKEVGHGDSWDQGEPDPETGEIPHEGWTAEDEQTAAAALKEQKQTEHAASELAAEALETHQQPQERPVAVTEPLSRPEPKAAPAAPAVKPSGSPKNEPAKVTGFIRDINEWRKVLAEGEKLGYNHPNHIKGTLVKEGWTSFNTGDSVKAIATLMDHQEAKKKEK